MRPVYVVGCGGPMGDDAVGWEVIRRLRDESPPPSADLHVISGGHQLLDLLDGPGALVLVDAICSGRAPGSVHRFAWPDQRIDSLRPGTTHDLRLGAALELAFAMGLLPRQVTVVGIEAASFEPAAVLSPAVAAAIPHAVQVIVAELESFEHATTT